MYKKITVLSLSLWMFLFIGVSSTLADESSYTINLSGWVENVTPITYVQSYEHATYTHDHYFANGNHFRLTTVDIHKGDTLYFARNYIGASENTVTLEITAHDPTLKRTTRLNTTGGKTWEHLSLPPSSFNLSLYVDGEDLSYRIGKVDLLAGLGHSVLQHFDSGKTLITQTKQEDEITYSVPLPATRTMLAETWGILAEQPIIPWDNNGLARLAAQNEFDYEKTLAVDGAYYATPNSYVPYTPNSYYRNPAHLDGLRSVPYLDSERFGSIFTNIATHLAYAAVRNQYRDGYWPTLPMSEWLSREYHIGYAYMDNRRNVDNTLFLLRFNAKRPDPSVEQALDNWNEYQLRYINDYSLAIPNGGIFIPDYVGDKNARYSHISLNHLAANMNYLYEAYLVTGDTRQLQAADEMRKGIANTKERWVRSDFNLYYALTPQLTPYPAEDYHTLTRDDLVDTQQLLMKIYSEQDEDIQFLIDEKNKWIEANHPSKK